MAMKDVAGIGGEILQVEVPDTRVFSKLKVVKKLMGIGVWERIKAFLEERGAYDLFLMAQDFSGNDDDFKAGIAAVKELLGWTDEQVEDVLADCVIRTEPAQ